MSKKVINIIIFLLSAILCALFISLTIKSNIKQDIEEPDISIKSNKDFYIGNTSFSDILNEKNTNIANKEINKTNSNKDSEITLKDTYEDTVDIGSIIKSETSNETMNNDNLDKIYENPPKQTDINKILDEDLDFLTSLVSIGDEVANNYNDILSYALSGNFDEGKKNIKLLEENLNNLNKLKTNDNNLEKTKKHYADGIKYFIKGFNEYFNYKSSANDTLIKADTAIYNAQENLNKFLEKYKLN